MAQSALLCEWRFGRSEEDRPACWAIRSLAKQPAQKIARLCGLAPPQGVKTPKGWLTAQASVSRHTFVQHRTEIGRNRRRLRSQYRVQQPQERSWMPGSDLLVGRLPLQPPCDRHDVVGHDDIADRLHGVRECPPHSSAIITRFRDVSGSRAFASSGQTRSNTRPTSERQRSA